MKELISRNENFGMTVFDPNNFKHYFLDHDSLKTFKHSTIKLSENKPFLKRKDIIYSPIRVYFDLTYLCNLSCISCLNDSGKKRSNELSTNQVIKTLEGLKDDFVFDIRFSGGEPTLKKDWFDLLSKAKDLGFAVSLNTNGDYSYKTLEMISELELNEITVSVDGFGKNHDFIRGKGSFENSINTIKYLSNKGCKVSINSAVSTLTNEFDIDGLLNFSNKYCDNISFFHLRPIGRAKQNAHLCLNYDSLSNLMDFIDDKKKTFGTVRTRGSSLLNNAIHNNELGLIEGGSDGFTRFNIMPDGSMYAGGCALYVNDDLKNELCLGNIVDENYTILNIWRNSPKLDSIRKRSMDLKMKCNGCDDYKKKCSGFTMEMDYYARFNNEGNIYCKRND